MMRENPISEKECSMLPLLLHFFVEVIVIKSSTKTYMHCTSATHIWCEFGRIMWCKWQQESDYVDRMKMKTRIISSCAFFFSTFHSLPLEDKKKRKVYADTVSLLTMQATATINGKYTHYHAHYCVKVFTICSEIVGDGVVVRRLDFYAIETWFINFNLTICMKSTAYFQLNCNVSFIWVWQYMLAYSNR